MVGCMKCKKLVSKMKSNMPGPLAKEHARLVEVLESPSRKDDLREAKKQKKELAEYIRKGE